MELLALPLACGIISLVSLGFIAKNIISEHNQEIWVESKMGIGTKFTFTLDYFKNSLED